MDVPARAGVSPLQSRDRALCVDPSDAGGHEPDVGRDADRDRQVRHPVPAGKPFLVLRPDDRPQDAADDADKLAHQDAPAPAWVECQEYADPGAARSLRDAVEVAGAAAVHQAVPASSCQHFALVEEHTADASHPAPEDALGRPPAGGSARQAADAWVLR